MEKVILSIKSRSKSGSSNSRRFRNAGEVPVVINFPDASSISGLVVEKDFVHLAERSRYTDVFTLSSEDEKLNNKQVLVKSLQKEPLKGKVLHVDFQALEAGARVKVHVPVTLTGTPAGVKTQGGILTQASRTVVLSCLPENIPQDVTADVSELNVGDRILASEIPLSEGLFLKSNARETIASVVASRTTRLQEASGTTGEEGGEKTAEGNNKES